MNHTEVRISELNHCKRLMSAVDKRLRNTSDGADCYGLRRAMQIMMDRKKELRAQLAALRVDGGAE